MSSHEIVPVDDPTDVFVDMDPIFPDDSPTSQFTRCLPLPKRYVWVEREPFDSEMLPETLASGIQRFLRVANLVEPEEPRVAFLCRFYAFEVAHRIDNGFGTGRGVRQFKTSLLHRLDKDNDFTLNIRKDWSDRQELKRVYHAYKEYFIKHGAITLNLDNSQREKLIDAGRIASVLYEILKVFNKPADYASTPESIEWNEDEETSEIHDIMVTLKTLEDLSLTPTSQGDTSVQSTNLTQDAIEAIHKEEVQIKKDGRFGYEDDVRSSSAVPSSFYEDKYLETLEKLNKMEKKIKEMDLKLVDFDFWASLMQNMFPDQVPPSLRANQTEKNNNNG